MMVEQIGSSPADPGGRRDAAGAVVQALGVRALRIGPEICAWRSLDRNRRMQPRLALALKSGNFGAEDFFETALEMLA